MIYSGVQLRLIKLGWTLVEIQKCNGHFRPTRKTLWTNPKYPDLVLSQKHAIAKERSNGASTKS